MLIKKVIYFVDFFVPSLSQGLFVYWIFEKIIQIDSNAFGRKISGLSLGTADGEGAKEKQADGEQVFGENRMRIAGFEDMAGIGIAGLAAAAALGL